jgi:hypothetical protein
LKLFSFETIASERSLSKRIYYSILDGIVLFTQY